MQGQGLAPGVGVGGDAVVDGSVEELVEFAAGFEVEGGGLAVAGQQSLPFEGAGGDGAEQALKFGLGRCGDAVETGRAVIVSMTERAALQERVDTRDDA